jgi:hypothetical protein
MKRAVVAVVCAGIVGACTASTTSDGASPAGSAKSSSTPPAPASEGLVPDPSEDAQIASAPRYVDVLSAGVSVSGAMHSFTFTLAGPIPSAFKVPAAWDALLWSFCLDTGNSDPSGYPFEASTPAPCEFIVTALSDGKRVTTALIDRRPLLDGSEATTSSIGSSSHGSTVTMSVPTARLDDPRRFTWVMAATALTLPWPNDEFLDIDEVPDSSFNDPASWPH